MPYDILLLSTIPVHHEADGGFSTVDLWARDINANSQAVTRIEMLCPVTAKGASGEVIGALDPAIRVHDVAQISDAALTGLVKGVDIVQLPGNFDWARSTMARRLLRIARREGRLVTVGISSNRAKTYLMNARGKGWLAEIKGLVKYADIRSSQNFLMARADGIQLVGSGLLPLVKTQGKSVHVGIASWIRASDICPPRPAPGPVVSIVMAARFEAMKGIGVGIDAVALLGADVPPIQLAIIGKGPEEAALRQQVEARGIGNITTFEGQLGYPEAFFERMRRTDFVLLTNLNDEQPRLIFDAISQGAIPVCPNNPAYGGLGLDPALFYEQGNAASLAQTVTRLIQMDPAARSTLNASLSKIAQERTIEGMHILRADWLQKLLAARAG